MNKEAREMTLEEKKEWKEQQGWNEFKKIVGWTEKKFENQEWTASADGDFFCTKHQKPFDWDNEPCFACWKEI